MPIWTEHLCVVSFLLIVPLDRSNLFPCFLIHFLTHLMSFNLKRSKHGLFLYSFIGTSVLMVFIIYFFQVVCFVISSSVFEVSLMFMICANILRKVGVLQMSSKKFGIVVLVFHGQPQQAIWDLSFCYFRQQQRDDR